MTTEAPFCAEREAYLAHLQKMGASYQELKLVAGYLLHIVRIFDRTSLRPVTTEQIQAAGDRWARYTGPERHTVHRHRSPRYVVRFATQWVNFLGLIPAPPKPAFHELLEDFDRAMINVRNNRPRRSDVRLLLCWLQAEVRCQPG
jgi:integrase/recombinase XerD